MKEVKFYYDNNIRELRTAANVTREELAKRSGVSYTAIRSYENGYRALGSASASTVLKLAEALNCDVKKLFC